MGALGTPTQWWNTLKNPSLWLNTKKYSDWNQEMTGDPDDILREEQRVAAEEARNAANKQDYETKAKAAADKIIADQAKPDEEAKTAAAALAKRRKATNPYSGSAKGVLGTAPVYLKTLLGE